RGEPSLRALERQTGINRSKLRDFSTGTVMPGPASLRRLLPALGVEGAATVRAWEYAAQRASLRPADAVDQPREDGAGRSDPEQRAGSFGTELRRRRTAAGLTLGQFAARVHYTKGYLSKVEIGEKLPGYDLAPPCDAELGGGGALIAPLPGGRRPRPGAASGAGPAPGCAAQPRGS